MKIIFKSIYRDFKRKPVTNIINLVGLAISLSLVLILSIYCFSELTTDEFHKKVDRIYLFGSDESVYTPGILKEYIDQNIPGVESTIRIESTWNPPAFQVEGKEPITSELIFADKDFFKLFSYKAIAGNPETALNDPMSVVITKRLSEKIFGNGIHIGESIKLNNNQELKVSAIIEELKENSCLSFNAITSIETMKIVQFSDEGEFTEWGYCNFQTFLLLENGVDPDEITQKILKIIPENFKEFYANVKLVPFKKVYFSRITLLGGQYIRTGDKNKTLVLLMTAALILIIALINFINISSSQWHEKIKQIGVIKVFGARRFAIIKRIIIEAYLFFLAALVLAIIMVIDLYPFINNYTGIKFNPQIIFSPLFLFISLLGIFIFSMVFSIIPALRISSSKVIDNLKKNVKSHYHKFSVRNILVVFQFTIAIILIAFTVLIQKQVNFGSSNPGFNQENIIGIKMTPQLDDKKDVIKRELFEKPAVRDVVFTQYFPGGTIQQWRAKFKVNEETEQLDFYTFSAEAPFFKIMGIKLMMGRYYSDDLSTDKGKVVVNETFLSKYNLDIPIGLNFSMGGTNYEIIGVVKDFHFESINKPIAPLAIRNDSYASNCLVNLQTMDFKTLNSTIQDLKKLVSDLSPAFPIEISFLDQSIKHMYQSELQFRKTFSLFAISAIVISCLGMLAMSLFSCQRRVKEIGIRKVNGAKVSEILTMLNKDSLKWVVIAFAIACPISYYPMKSWLENYAYKTTLSWWIFALAGLLALGIALLTVSLQTFRAASRNPVESLRYE